jgi:hypothetical protein
MAANGLIPDNSLKGDMIQLGAKPAHWKSFSFLFKSPRKRNEKLVDGETSPQPSLSNA